MASVRKKFKLVKEEPKKVATKVCYPKLKLYFVPGRIQTKRLQIMKDCALKNGYVVEEKLDQASHLLTEFENEDQVWNNLRTDSLEKDYANSVQIVTTRWLIDSVKEGKPLLPVPDFYRINTVVKTIDIVPNPKDDYSAYNCYACQRKTPLKHHNHVLTDALNVLIRHAELRDDDGDYVRACAFSKAAAVLKSLPFAITKSSQAAKLKDIGKHSLKVIQEILEDKFSEEIHQIKTDVWFNTMELFNTVYGVGPAMANKWFTLGLRTIAEVKERKLNFKLSDNGDIEKINHGLAFHEDLNTPLNRAEADQIIEFLKEEAEKISSGIQLQIAGGFRRGKPHGHDVDILFTHPERGKENILQQLHKRLTDMQFILYESIHKNSFNENKIVQEFKGAAFPERENLLDDFEKCFYIFRMPTDGSNFNTVELQGKILPPKSDFAALCQLADSPRNWRAIRIDLIIIPWDQYAFGLVGWTGNRFFERSIRLYSKRQMNMKFTNNGLWSYATQKRIPATTEKEVFEALNLEYLEPWERNC